jgi:hypothetical protein
MTKLEYRVPKWWPYQDQFPEWRVWRGDDRHLYARLPGTDPLIVVHGHDTDELREQIAAAQGSGYKLCPMTEHPHGGPAHDAHRTGRRTPRGRLITGC